MKEEERAILPKEGLWTIEDLANYLGVSGDLLQQKLTDIGVKTLTLSSRYKHKVISLGQVVEKIESQK